MSDRIPGDSSSGELWALQSMLVDAFQDQRDALEQRDAQHRAELDRLLSAMVDVLDSLDRLLRDETYLRSWRLITRQFTSALRGSGVEVIGSVGESADPHTHRVIETRRSTEVAEEVVLEVLRRGYRHQGRVLRPAEVIVATNPARATPATHRDAAGTREAGTADSVTDQEQG